MCFLIGINFILHIQLQHVMLFINLVVFLSRLSLIQYIVPGLVSKLSYKEDTDTSVNITWKPPKEPNGDIVTYIVEHGVYHNESTTSVTILARRPMYTVIQGLGKFLPFYSSVNPCIGSMHVCQPYVYYLKALFSFCVSFCSILWCMHFLYQ